MILPCEVAVKSVVPAVKALMAQQLVEDHCLKQDQVAEILGISQSAVSKYFRKVRGYVVEVDKVEEARPLIASMITMLINGEHQRAEFLELFCQTCAAVRKTGTMCRFCKRSEPSVKLHECNFCAGMKLKKERR